jgi:hypothetical protein
MSEGPKVRTAADLSDEEMRLLYHFDETLGRIWESYRLWHERPVINAMVDVPHIYSGWLPESNRDAIWHELFMKFRGKFLSSLLGHDVVSFLKNIKKPYQTMTLRYDYRVPESLLPADRIIGIGVIAADDAAAAPAPAAVPAPAAANPPVDPVVDLDADAEYNQVEDRKKRKRIFWAFPLLSASEKRDTHIKVSLTIMHSQPAPPSPSLSPRLLYRFDVGLTTLHTLTPTLTLTITFTFTFTLTPRPDP